MKHVCAVYFYVEYIWLIPWTLWLVGVSYMEAEDAVMKLAWTYCDSALPGCPDGLCCRPRHCEYGILSGDYHFHFGQEWHSRPRNHSNLVGRHVWCLKTPHRIHINDNCCCRQPIANCEGMDAWISAMWVTFPPSPYSHLAVSWQKNRGCLFSNTLGFTFFVSNTFLFCSTEPAVVVVSCQECQEFPSDIHCGFFLLCLIFPPILLNLSFSPWPKFLTEVLWHKGP